MKIFKRNFLENNPNQIIRFFIMLIVISSLNSCMSLLYNPCLTTQDPDKIDNQMMPIKTGNYWVYQFKSNKTDTTFKIKYEIGEKVKIKVPRKFKIKYTYVYKVIINGEESDLVYFKCDGMTSLATLNSNGLEVHNTFLENPRKRDDDPLWYKYYWYWYTDVKTPAGQFKCWTIEDYDTDGSSVGKNEFSSFVDDPYTAKNKISLAKNIGIVKSELIDQFGNLLSYIELIDFKVE